MRSLRISAVDAGAETQHTGACGLRPTRRFRASSLRSRVVGRIRQGVIARTRCLSFEQAIAEEGAMGQVIDLAERRDAAQRRTRRREPLRARALLRPRVPVHVSGGRAGRARVRARHLDRRRRRRRCSGAASRTTPSGADRVRAAAERARRAAAPAARLARALPARGAGRDARGARTPPSRAAAARSCWPPAGSRSRAASTSTTPRSWPRPRPPRASRSTTACTPRATSAATARRRRVGRRLLAAGADRLPALRVGRSLFWGEQRVGAAAASVRQASPALARRGWPSYGLTSPARICAFIASTVSGRSASSSTSARFAHA